jgi:hypothetical protein
MHLSHRNSIATSRTAAINENNVGGERRRVANVVSDDCSHRLAQLRPEPTIQIDGSLLRGGASEFPEGVMDGLVSPPTYYPLTQRMVNLNM